MRMSIDQLRRWIDSLHRAQDAQEATTVLLGASRQAAQTPASTVTMSLHDSTLPVHANNQPEGAPHDTHNTLPQAGGGKTLSAVEKQNTHTA